MDTTISYPEKIPTFGDHRPLWPIFGEYKFVPPQRWLHNIEHGQALRTITCVQRVYIISLFL